MLQPRPRDASAENLLDLLAGFSFKKSSKKLLAKMDWRTGWGVGVGADGELAPTSNGNDAIIRHKPMLVVGDFEVCLPTGTVAMATTNVPSPPPPCLGASQSVHSCQEELWPWP